MDSFQLIITLAIVVIAFTFVFIGIWMVLVLAAVRTGLKKINQILDTTSEITASIATPVSSFSEFLMGFKNGFAVFNKFFKNKSNNHEE